MNSSSLTKVLGTRVLEDEYSRVVEIAKASGSRPSDIVRVFIRQGLSDVRPSRISPGNGNPEQLIS